MNIASSKGGQIEFRIITSCVFSFSCWCWEWNKNAQHYVNWLQGESVDAEKRDGGVCDIIIIIIIFRRSLVVPNLHF